ncbi:MAG TPA: NAD(P)-dependent oxidoreductase [Acidimicrobiales bacterium]|nr:NAD(P)-dependent oxidoreductase [Acidimicrobiales bacterium]
MAAPAWAARALGVVGQKLARSVIIQHVVVGESPIAPNESADVHVLWRYHLPAERVVDAIGQLSALRWIHSDYVGIEDLPIADIGRRGILLSNGAGMVARPMAEWVVLAILAAAKQLPRFVRQSDAANWVPGAPLAELSGAVTLILGLGSVGATTARLLEPFAMDVRACVHRPRPPGDPLPRGVNRLVVGDAWRDHLADANYVVCALPLTDVTNRMLDLDAFEALRPDCWLVNVARGGLVDDAALIAALDAGRLAGAVLDAFNREPLPSDDPLWGRPNVLILPHVTWSTAHTSDDFKARFAAQVARWVVGEPPADLVDLGTGY